MDDFDVDDLSPEKLPSAIYNCLECSNKVAHGDKFCRHCGIEFTPVHCEQMIGNLKLVGKDSFWHLVLIVLFVLVIIFGLVLF